MALDTPVGGGLRERKKQATRQALIQAAVRLARERGPDRTRVEDIAAAAGVSPRTFNNYFSSKEEAIASAAVDRAERTAEALVRRPADEPLADALRHALADEHPDPSVRDPEARAQLRLIMWPQLRAEYHKAELTMERRLAAAIAERTGTGTGRDLYPRTLAAAVVAALRVATTHWASSGKDVRLGDIIAEAVGIVVSPVQAGRGGK
ncbi:MAG TPA: TetR/AcrR family transcriptional regulator [Candidatus Dormibacteraeota bacterium]|nr:TetR/AcrR family transcriptional regulator [Candidatus Dormibacteraeota bacterium]